MDIQDVFLYFAQFPSEEGVKAAFTNGCSDFGEYEELLQKYDSSPKGKITDINNYIFGQDFDNVRKIVDAMTGNYLLVEIGNIDSIEDLKGRINDTMKIAVTVAYKATQNIDLIDHMIISNRSLNIINKLRASLRSDQVPWLRMMESNTQIQPFVSGEFSSIGWSFMFNLKGQIFDIR